MRTNEATLRNVIKSCYPNISKQNEEELLDRLIGLDLLLKRNLDEYIEGTPLTEYRIRDKYSVNAVLAIRNDTDVLSALLDLDAYAKEPDKEYLLWRTRM